MIQYNINAVKAWAEDRNIIDGSNTHSQMLKLTEELGELASGIAKNNREVQIDSIGDVLVVLIIISAQLNIDIGEALRFSYNEIKHRKGKMINGVFVKEADL